MLATRLHGPLTLALAALLLALSPARAAAQLRDRSVRWRTVNTEHFAVHYPAHLGPVARRAGYALERAHARVAPVLENEMSGRVQVTLADDSESANGLATALPYDAIRLFATAPEDMSALADFDDWLTTLITHEHSHILHLSNISGLPAVINRVFGRLLAPNQTQPRFIVEGLATYLESRETSGGRMRSTQFDMYLRMAFLEGRVLTLDQLATGVDQWPHGAAWYLYGSRLMAFVAEQHGEHAIAEIADTYGRNPIPYGLSRATQRATGSTWPELFDAWQAAARGHYELQAQSVEAAGRVEGERLTRHGETALYPRFMPDGSLVYMVNDGRSDPQLRRLPAGGGRAEKITRVAGGSVPSPLADGSIVYDSVDFDRGIYARFDLFRKHPGRRRPERLTTGLRARAPDVSPDGARVVFTVNDGGTSHLELATLSDVEGTRERLVTSGPFEQVYTPRFSPDGQQVVYSVWRAGGYRDVHLLDLRTRTVRELTHDRALDLGPTFTPDGQQVVFSSDRSGIANLYAMSLATGETRQLTNVLGGAYCPAVSPDGERVVYVGYGSFGFDLYALPLLGAPGAWGRPALPYEDTRPAPSDTGYLGGPSHRYRPVETLYPRSYAVGFESNSLLGGSLLSLAVNGEDAVGWFSWSTRVGLTLPAGEVDLSTRGRYQRGTVPVAWRFFRQHQARNDLFVMGRRQSWRERAVGGDISLSRSFPRSFHSTTLSGGYAVTHIRSVDPFTGELDPNFPVPYVPDRGFFTRARLGFVYSDARAQIYDMTTSVGRTLSVSMSAADPVIGNRYRAAALSWGFSRYWENPLIHHHVFALRYTGGLSAGDAGRRALYSIGGFPSPDFQELLFEHPVYGGQALRGYAPGDRRGLRFQLVQLEYRFPIVRIQHGLQTTPFYLNRMHALVFADYGDAYSTRIDLSTFRLGVGAEVLLDFTVGYFLPFTLRLGFAYGAHEGGGPRLYFHLGRPF
ncbi:MAG: PD40 domain-containing protein [Myxococcales bacterium]|nr:PD40 domain-containing protein [Myxococcales bacterium]MCB9626329.1 PD40 domain-containing protein [Sandaracinaceae bacterium]